MLAVYLSDRSTSGSAAMYWTRGSEQIAYQTDLDNIKQFCHDGCNTPEERRTSGAFHLMAVSFDFDKCALLCTNVL